MRSTPEKKVQSKLKFKAQRIITSEYDESEVLAISKNKKIIAEPIDQKIKAKTTMALTDTFHKESSERIQNETSEAKNIDLWHEQPLFKYFVSCASLIEFVALERFVMICHASWRRSNSSLKTRTQIFWFFVRFWLQKKLSVSESVCWLRGNSSKFIEMAQLPTTRALVYGYFMQNVLVFLLLRHRCVYFYHKIFK